MDYRRRHHFPYLIIYTGVIAFCLNSCQNTLPQIKLSPTSYPKYRISVGQFSAKSPKNNDFAVFSAQYLDKKLSKLTPATGYIASKTTDHPAKNTQAEINGYIKLTSIPSPFKDNEITVKTEICFTLTIKGMPGQILTNTFIRPAHTPRKSDIQAALCASVDEYLAEMFPDRETITCRMARGWTEFDRLGRKMVSRHNYTQALVYFLKAVDARPDDYAALYNTALVYEALGHYHQAAVFCKRALDIQDNPLYRKCLQRLQQKMGPPQ